MTRQIFNGDWEKLPDSIKSTLKERAPNNNHGEIVKVFMIYVVLLLKIYMPMILIHMIHI